MTFRDDLVRADKAHVWHPYTPMDVYIERVDPIVVASAKGARFTDVDGRSYLDGNASWWVASLGHGHPRLVDVLTAQARTLAHVSLGGITHEPAAKLAEELVEAAPRGLSRVFYTDNGSGSVEVAVKIALQRARRGFGERRCRFMALDGAFHGDTVGAASLGGVEVFRRPFAHVLFECVHVPFPDEESYARAFATMRTMLEDEGETFAAVVVEPLLQGASGMRVYSAEFLRELRALCDRKGVLLVFDEVFTGYGRTGAMWASELAGVTPDVLCLGKTFASLLPMGATLVTEDVFDAFRGPPEHALYYGHTFAGNPLGAALAREVLAIYRDEEIVAGVRTRAPLFTAMASRLATMPGVLRTRSLGFSAAVDLDPRAGSVRAVEPAGAETTEDMQARGDAGAGYLSSVGWTVYAEALARGAYVRPLGSTVYVTPPLTSTESELEELFAIFEASVAAALGEGPSKVAPR
ncbi:MAG: adenosylmethionine--8-amino-7-oxononanoate transaminase [Polyangiaceae bacterium]